MTTSEVRSCARQLIETALLIGVLLAVCPASAQTDVVIAQPAAAASQSLPAEAPGTTAVQARVIDVKGRAQHAPVGTAVTDAQAWQPIHLDDVYSAGTLVRTSLGSHVTLQFGSEEPYTVVMVERMTLANLTSLYKTATEKVSRVSVNYGAIRGGVSEGGLRSSFVVDSTVATLTKRGTWGFRLFVERGTGRYTISLADRGLVEALNNITRQRQALSPGQYVTQAMIRWVDQTTFDRLITMQDRFGLTVDEIQFLAFNSTGLGVIDPAPNAGTQQFVRAGADQFASQQILQNQNRRLQNGTVIQPPPTHPVTPPPTGVIGRPEGDFNGSFR
jgi:hypothetical protein